MMHRKILMIVIITVAVFIGCIGMASAGESVAEVSELYAISASTYPADLDPQPSGSGTYEKGASIAVVASQYTMSSCPPDATCPMEVFPFFRWTEDGITVSYDLSYSFIVNEDRNLVADYSGHNSCTAKDINSDGFVNIDDVLIMISHWGQNWPTGDFNDDNIINIDDVLRMIPFWGTCT